MKQRNHIPENLGQVVEIRNVGDKPDIQACNFLPLVMMTSLETGLHQVFLHSIIVQSYSTWILSSPRWKVLLIKCSTQTHLCFHMSVMYTKLSFQMFSSYFHWWYHGIFNCSFPSICRGRDSSEESFRLVIKIWKLNSWKYSCVF